MLLSYAEIFQTAVKTIGDNGWHWWMTSAESINYFSLQASIALGVVGGGGVVQGELLTHSREERQWRVFDDKNGEC